MHRNYPRTSGATGHTEKRATGTSPEVGALTGELSTTPAVPASSRSGVPFPASSFILSSYILLCVHVCVCVFVLRVIAVFAVTLRCVQTHSRSPAHELAGRPTFSVQRGSGAPQGALSGRNSSNAQLCASRRAKRRLEILLERSPPSPHCSRASASSGRCMLLLLRPPPLLAQGFNFVTGEKSNYPRMLRGTLLLLLLSPPCPLPSAPLPFLPFPLDSRLPYNAFFEFACVRHPFFSPCSTLPVPPLASSPTEPPSSFPFLPPRV